MQKSRSSWRFHYIVAALLLLLSFDALAYTQSRVLKGPDGKPVKIEGSVVMIEPNIELSEVLAGGVQEPRQAWSETARRLYPQAVKNRINNGRIKQLPDFMIPKDLEPSSRLGQVIRLNYAVSSSILISTMPGGQLATKKGKQLDWSFGPGVEEIRKQTGADYALFTYVRDSYTSGGQAALRIIGILLLGGDIGGGQQIGVTTLVDLRTGQVVWFNFLAKQTGDLRDEKGAAATAQSMLKGFPL
ncbi:MAG: hypothetical protein ACREO1_04805 [Arenimonas sp.]